MSKPDPPRRVDPVIEAYKRDVDMTLVRENLKRTPEERLLRLMELQRLAEELQRAGREAKDSKDEALAELERIADDEPA